MKMLEGRVAAVTGAASGLGRAMALAFAGEGMHAALADVDEPGLKSTLSEVQSRGVRAFAMRVDVSRYQEVESFCSKAIAQFGATHVVCNNAGVSPLGAVWENTLADWQWILGVNLWGVIHGVRAAQSARALGEPREQLLQALGHGLDGDRGQQQAEQPRRDIVPGRSHLQ